MPAVTIPSPPKDEQERHQQDLDQHNLEDPSCSNSPNAPAPASAAADTRRDYFDHKPSRSRSSSPERPPVSPITPITSHAEIAPLPNDFVAPALPPPEFISAPRPQPIKDWNENEDVLALRSAISLLQMQRDKAKKDLVKLEHVKHTAVADPDGYLGDVKARKSAPPKPIKTLADILRQAEADALAPTVSDNSSDDDEEQPAALQGLSKDVLMNGTSGQPKFEVAPQPQNIIRCPPINWAKYQVVGDTLDKMHAEQVAHPNLDPFRSSARAPPHYVAAPYSPFTDHISRPSEPNSIQRKSAKKPNT